MKILAVTPENIEREHICCAISDKKGDPCVAAKKDWMRERFADGLVFKRLDALDAEDDVSAVYSNEDVSDEAAAKYEG